MKFNNIISLSVLILHMLISIIKNYQDTFLNIPHVYMNFMINIKNDNTNNSLVLIIHGTI